jgi:tetratricopeptide (TPR) repeat protein
MTAPVDQNPTAQRIGKHVLRPDKIFVMRTVSAAFAVVGAAALLSAACAPKTVMPPVVSAPKFPDFVRPLPPSALAGGPVAARHDRAWAFLQAGDLQNAERETVLVLKAAPAFFPAEATAGYIEMAREQPHEALTRFDRALARQSDYVPALAGRGQALMAASRDADALAAFEAALALDPSLTDVRRRVEVLRFRTAEQRVAAAREAARTGRAEDAARAYSDAIASSPDSAFLYRELAEVERQKGDVDLALTHLRKAVELDPGDAASFRQIGEVLEGEGDLSGALSAYDAALLIDGSDATRAKRDAIRTRMALATLPDEYRAIDSAAQVTRGDLAALVGVRLGGVLTTLRSADDVAVLTDVRAHWAERWIIAVAQTGVMQPFANHTFQPRAFVRRADLADAVTRLLSRAAPPALVREWQASQTTFADISTGHLAYPAAAFAVAAGVMAPTPAGNFEPGRVVAGPEAVAAAERLAALLGVRQLAIEPL